MNSEEPQSPSDKSKVRGRKSYVLKGKSKGGMITVRLSEDLHQRIANYCQKKNISMNKFILATIKKTLSEEEPCPAKIVDNPLKEKDPTQPGQATEEG